MNNGRKEELIKYIALLRSLWMDGMKCEKELNQALQELHSLMLRVRKGSYIVVFESSAKDVVKSVKTFQNLLGDGITTRVNQNGDQKITCENICIEFLNIDSEHRLEKLEKMYRGHSVDFIINNTDIKCIAEKMGIQIKP